MTMWVAKDGSHNYGAATQHDIGVTGQFCVAAIRRRLGQSRQFVLKCSVTSPYRRDVMALAIQADRESS